MALRTETGLEGKLKTVELLRPIGKNNSALGVFNGQYTIVTDACNARGLKSQIATVRFPFNCLYSDHDTPVCTYINSDNSGEIDGLTNDKYVLLANWKSRMGNLEQNPSLEKVNEFFDPGKLGFTLFIYNTDFPTPKAMTIGYQGIRRFEKPFENLLTENLPKREHNCKMIISKGRKTTQNVENTIKELGYVPVRILPKHLL
jgi:hypothetical protein